MIIRIERTANPTGAGHWDYCAVVDGMEEEAVQAHGRRPLVAVINLLVGIDCGSWDHIDPDTALQEGITIRGQAQ